jgi:hypothetical protein
MISREEALELLKAQGQEQAMIAHAIESEAVMRGVAEKLGRDADLWGLTGLLHDVDYERTRDEPAKHGLIGAEMLEGKLPPEAIEAIKAHNGEENGAQPSEEFDHALRACETLTGLIHANALIRPGGMDGMKPKSIKKKMKEKAFAAKVRREVILECEKFGLEQAEFFAIGIAAIQSVADQAGLA